MPWFDKVFTRFECCRYTANRLVAVRHGQRWFRNIHCNTQEHVEFIDTAFEDDYSMYVNGFTIDWARFRDEVGYPPVSVLKMTEYSRWCKEHLIPVMHDYIGTKDLVFDVDGRDGTPLAVVGAVALRIMDYLDEHGMPYHVMFSGRKGYHIVADDMERYLDDYKVNMLGSSLQSLSYGAIALAQSVLDDALVGDVYVDHAGQGRSYDDVNIDFSPMYPQGVRKAAYSITNHGTIALPVGRSELRHVDSIDYYRPEPVLQNYKIKGRGIP